VLLLLLQEGRNARLPKEWNSVQSWRWLCLTKTEAKN
jgi:hypothetical protein